jgi:hypothetical protein
MSTSYGTSSSIFLPDSANNVISYIRERLGEPVVQVNVTDQQILSRISDALQFFRDYNEDGIEKTYISHMITQEDVDNQWVPTANNVYEIVRVLSPTNIDKNIMTDITYNMRHSINFNEFMMSAYTGAFTEYSLMQMKIQEINDMFMGAKSIRYNRFQNELHWQGLMRDQFSIGDYFVYEAYVIMDPEVYGRMLGDRRFLNLATAYVKRQWGEILTKFMDIPLFGGIKLNGNAILQQGNTEVEKAEQDIITSAQPALDFLG